MVLENPALLQTIQYAAEDVGTRSMGVQRLKTYLDCEAERLEAIRQ